MALLKSYRLYICLVFGVGSVIVLCFMSFKDKLIVKEDIGPVGPLNIVMGSSITIDEKVNPGCKQRNPVNSYRPIIRAMNYRHPSIVHFAKFVKKASEPASLKFLEYMSMLSVYKIMKPEEIWIHSNGQINGKYWNLTQKWSGTAVKIIHNEKVTHFGKTKVTFFEHMADYTKLLQVLNNGGIAMDFDVIMINHTKLAEMQRLSECVLVQEGGAIRISFFSCIKGAPYLQAMIDSYHTDYRPSWVYNAGAVPTRLLTAKRSDCFNVYVETEICKPNYMDVHKTWMQHNKVNWRIKPAAHYYKRNLKLPKEDESILNGNSSFSEMLQYIYTL